MLVTFRLGEVLYKYQQKARTAFDKAVVLRFLEMLKQRVFVKNDILATYEARTESRKCGALNSGRDSIRTEQGGPCLFRYDI